MTEVALTPHARAAFVDGQGRLTAYGLRLLDSVLARTGGRQDIVNPAYATALLAPVGAALGLQGGITPVSSAQEFFDISPVLNGAGSCMGVDPV